MTRGSEGWLQNFRLGETFLYEIWVRCSLKVSILKFLYPSIIFLFLIFVICVTLIRWYSFLCSLVSLLS